ncbi:MAG TPA: hypothetical protein VG796_30475 [Verrucomicrobiales bacterium]|nr:hypothetical protein [Verrucomicrobiales bacterium]
MTPRDLNRLLHAASAEPVPSSPKERAASVWQSISRGWDPEQIEWQRWLRRWWPWAALAVLAAAATVAEWPHGRHSGPDSRPPALQLFQEAAGSPSVTARS